MKDFYLNNMLQELNSISRMAVIENAFITEKMASTYSKLLKYRWKEENQKVTAAKELDIVLKCCELFRLKHNGLLEYKYIEKSDIKTIFIPHYTIVACLKSILAECESMGQPVKLQIEANQYQEFTEIIFEFRGNADFNEVLKKANHNSKQLEYESFSEAEKRWKDRFGEESFKLAIPQRNHEQLDIILCCK